MGELKGEALDGLKEQSSECENKSDSRLIFGRSDASIGGKPKSDMEWEWEGTVRGGRAGYLDGCPACTDSNSPKEKRNDFRKGGRMALLARMGGKEGIPASIPLYKTTKQAGGTRETRESSCQFCERNRRKKRMRRAMMAVVAMGQ